MPGQNLTRDEAQTRASLLTVHSASVELDLSTSDTTFGSTTTLRFSCANEGSDTFADLVNATVHEVVLNGRALDPAAVYADSRLLLSDLRADNELRVVAECTYSRVGEGLHRFVDPVDGRTYLYSQFEVPDARQMYTTFEQPDLKDSTGRYRWVSSAASRWSSTLTPTTSWTSRNVASRSSRPSSTRRTRSRSTTSCSSPNTTWGRWRTPAA
jgi:hypothetical protein